MPLLSEEQLEAGAARLAKSLTLPGTRPQEERQAVYERVGEFLAALQDAGHACSASTAEDMLWAACSMEERRHALHWALVLAEHEQAVLQWQQLPDIFTQLITEQIHAKDAVGPAGVPASSIETWGELLPHDLAEALIKVICPAVRQKMVLQQLWSRVGHPNGSPAQGARPAQGGGLLVDVLLSGEDSDSGSDQDIEDMVFSDDSDDERL